MNSFEDDFVYEEWVGSEEQLREADAEFKAYEDSLKDNDDDSEY